MTRAQGSHPAIAGASRWTPRTAVFYPGTVSNVRGGPGRRRVHASVAANASSLSGSAATIARSWSPGSAGSPVASSRCGKKLRSAVQAGRRPLARRCRVVCGARDGKGFRCLGREPGSSNRGRLEARGARGWPGPHHWRGRDNYESMQRVSDWAFAGLVGWGVIPNWAGWDTGHSGTYRRLGNGPGGREVNHGTKRWERRNMGKSGEVNHESHEFHEWEPQDDWDDLKHNVLMLDFVASPGLH